MIRKATREDLDIILKIYAYARRFMRENGNPDQWRNDRPTTEAVLHDMNEGNLYVIAQKEKVDGVFALIIGHDETYDVITGGNWLNDEPYGVIHKIASAEGASGVLSSALAFAESKVSNIRIDTHRDNKVMQHLLVKNGFTYCGIIITDDGTERMAYQKTIGCNH